MPSFQGKMADNYDIKNIGLLLKMGAFCALYGSIKITFDSFMYSFIQLIFPEPLLHARWGWHGLEAGFVIVSLFVETMFLNCCLKTSYP